MVQDVTGDVLYPVRYTAIVFMPYTGEVLDVIVTEATELGFFAQAGPLKLCVAKENMFREYQYDNKGSSPSWISGEDPALRIERNSKCRVKLVGTKVDENEIFAIGTIVEDYLGPIRG